MPLCVTGMNSTIVKELRLLLPDGETVERMERIQYLDPLAGTRFLFCQGALQPIAAADQSYDTMLYHSDANWLRVMQACEKILLYNHEARIVVMGSMSGIDGSFNETYASAKAALHHYVRTKKLVHPEQQLAAVAPTIIADSGMTNARPDKEACLARGLTRRRGSWLSAAAVARLVHFLLYVDDGSVCNTVIEVTGGNW